MSIEVKVTLEDHSLENYMRYHMITGRAGMYTVVLGMLNLGLSVAFIIRGDWKYAMMFLVFVVVILVVFPARAFRNIRIKAGKISPEARDVLYVFDEEGIYTATSSDEGKAVWDVFTRIDTYKNLVLISDKTRRAIILPREQIGERGGELMALFSRKISGKNISSKLLREGL